MAGSFSRFIERVYVKLFSKPSMQKFNDKLLQFALKGRGYNNYETNEETGETQFLKTLAKFNPGLCIDIGANNGRYSRSILEIPGTRVIAFEPLPQTFKKLGDIKAQYADRFEGHNMGVGDANTFLELNYSEEASEFASFSKEVNNIDYVGKSNVNTVKVAVTTLDSFLKDKNAGEITLLKIDTEGFEHEVLTGAAETLKNNPPKFVQIEFNYHQLFRKQSLYSLSQLLPGYEAYQLLPFNYGMARRNPKLPESNFYYFSNFIFVRADIVGKI